LLLAFIALASAGLFVQSGHSTKGIWVRGNKMLLSANRVANGKPASQ
jgi:hypothetical protein